MPKTNSCQAKTNLGYHLAAAPNTMNKRPHYDKYKDLAEALRRKAKRENIPCHICGRPINWSVDVKHPQAFTYDHLNPIANGGNPRGKGAPAHRSCNSRRSNRVDYTQQKPRTTTNW